MGTTSVAMSYDGASSMLGNSRNILLHTDAEGRFDTVFVLKEPAYFNISRNTLYLTPGDDLTVKITQNNEEAEFSGKGAEANTYMKDRLFPHGGSFLNGGQNIQRDFPATYRMIDSLSRQRSAQLDALTGVSDEFKSLEQARIKADVLISYIYYPIYANMMAQGRKNVSFAVHNTDSFYTSLGDEARKAVGELNQDKYLDVAAVRSALRNILSSQAAFRSWTEGITFSARTQELLEAAQYANKLRRQVNPELLAETKAYIDKMQNKDFANEMQAKLEQAGKLMKGRAIDFELTDTEGKLHRLSDFKGKVIYIDFWATWCGPCIQESPHFESLSKEFEGRDVVFLPISTDTGRKTWINYLEKNKKQLTQYNSTDRMIRDGWAIFYIPRFVLIDKDFNIANAYAPRPSEPEAKTAIETLLKQ